MAGHGPGYSVAVRIVVLGATGNVGTNVVEQLVADDRVESIVGIARRRPAWRPDRSSGSSWTSSTAPLPPS